MPTFALISEGQTDQIILERMINEICDEMFEDYVDVNPLQPLRDVTDAPTAPHGGWELVFEYCEARATDALAANDYVVIHLDTDQGDHPKFGVPLTERGVDRPYGELVVDTIDVLAERLGDLVFKENAERFLFAISVHSMESWLLLYFFDRDEPKNSMNRLNYRLRKANQKPLVKEVSAYRRIARDIKRSKLKMLSGTNNSLGLFLERLSELGSPSVPVA